VRRSGREKKPAEGLAELAASSVPEEEIKDVYAHFGLSYYMAEVMHRGLCNLYVLLQSPDAGNTRLRVEEQMSYTFSTTLGELAPKVEAVFPEDIRPIIREAVERRNFLAHHFWYERVHLMVSSEGCSRMVEELEKDRVLFETVDRHTDLVTEEQHARVGITTELIDSALAETLAGKPFEPLLKRRKLRKQEIVINAYRTDLASGGYNLIFETEDGVLWQLCDVGLGWTVHETVEPAWRPVEQIASYLPATINPRPHVQAPWSYEISLGGKAKLVVGFNSKSGQFAWRVVPRQ
jgi:hypothetical protein